jgi:polysaccharide export outer membrane protein
MQNPKALNAMQSSAKIVAKYWVEVRLLRAKILSALVAALVICSSCETASAPAPSAAAPVQGGETAYRLGPGDKLRIITYGEVSLTGEFGVNDVGQVSLPLIGSIKANGLTVSQLAAAITVALQNGYIKNPSVSVEVANNRPFYILGEVVRPGEYPFINGLTITSAVATAGGYTYRANTHRVFVRGVHDASEHVLTVTGDLRISPGDTIRVPERYF